MLRGEPYKARDLAGLLGFTVDETESVLALYGYEQDQSPGTWVYAAGFPERGIAAMDLSAVVVVALRKEVMARYPDTRYVDEMELYGLLSELIERAAKAAEDTGT